MKYYSVIHTGSEVKDSWFLSEVSNYSDFEIKKLNTQREVEIKDVIDIEVDPEFGNTEIDFNLCVSGITIISEKFKTHLSPEVATCYPVNITNHSTTQQYFALRLNIFYDCVDESASEFKLWTAADTKLPEKIGKYKTLSRLKIIDTETIKAGIFRLEKYFPMIIVSETFKIKLEQDKISGIGFSET